MRPGSPMSSVSDSGGHDSIRSDSPISIDDEGSSNLSDSKNLKSFIDDSESSESQNSTSSRLENAKLVVGSFELKGEYYLRIRKDEKSGANGGDAEDLVVLFAEVERERPDLIIDYCRRLIEKYSL